MTLDEYRRRVAAVRLPENVRAAIEVLLDHVERTGGSDIADHTDHYLMLGTDADGLDCSVELLLDLHLM